MKVFLRSMDDDDDDEVLRNGEKLRVPLTMMDHVLPGHRGLYTFTDDGGSSHDKQLRDAVRKAYAARNERLNSAWKRPPPMPPSPAQADNTDKLSDAELRALDSDDLNFRAAEAHRRRTAKLVDAWRRP